MRNKYRIYSAVLLLALFGCTARPPLQYQPAQRPQIDPLPPELKDTTDKQLCQRLLRIFSASPEILQQSCGNATG